MNWGVFASTFFAATIEVIEMVAIVVTVGVTRSWRVSLLGATAGFLLLAVSLVETAHPHHLSHDLGVEAVALRLGIDFADVGGERRLLLFQPLNTLDE